MNPLPISTLVALAALLLQTNAQTVSVTFGADGGADVVTTDQDLTTDTFPTFIPNTDHASTVTYGTTPPTPTSFNIATSSAIAANVHKVDEIGTDRDAINVTYNGLADLDGMVVWEDFPNGTIESFETNIQSNGSGDIFTNPASGSRYLIQKKTSGNWYISSQVHTFSNNNYFGGGTTTTASSLSWFDFTPHNAGAATIGSAATIDLTDIGSVGIYFQVHGTGSGTLGTRLRYFKATLTPDGNTAPTVDITAPTNGATIPPGNNVLFTGTAADLQDGDLSAGIAWSSSIDGALGSGASISTTALTAGTHTITATATDTEALSGDDSITLNITVPGNMPPVVTITAPANNSAVTVGSTVNFTGTAVDNEDGNIAANLVWSSNIDGPLGSGASISAPSLSLGTHTITTTATDSGALNGNASITLTVNDPGNTPPTVTVTAPTNGATIIAGTATIFTATATDTDDGDVSSTITWASNINGPLGNGASINVSALSLGTHTITASAADSSMLVGQRSIIVTVKSAITPGGARPNVIVIISDDAGYADFSFMDGLSGETSEVPTPHLDALAARGVTFARAYVAANCQPTRAALVTGAYQQRIGNESVGNDLFLLEDIEEGVPVATDTVWDRMKALGYNTGAIGKWHLGQTEDQPATASIPARLGNRPQNQGIDEFYGMWHGSRNYLAGTYNRNATSDPTHPLQPRFIREAIVQPNGTKTDTIVEFTKFADVPTAPQYITNIFGQYAVDFVKDHYDDDEPFFLYVAHPAPHKPWTDESPDFNDPRINGGAKSGGGNYPNLVGFRKQVASMMITMDNEIGRLIDTLEDPNGDMDTSDSITDNTLVIFINDNGGVAGRDAANGNVNGTSNGKLNGFKGSAHDGGIRVPMILAGAGLDPSKYGTVFYDPVHGVDILPTAVALGGGTIDRETEKIDGVDLLPFLNGTDPAAPHEVLVHKWRGSFAVIQGDWKLFNNRNINASPDFYELYKMTSGAADDDVAETNNVISAPANAALVEELKRHLTDHEAFFDKPRYAIRSNTLETEPLNIFDHHVFHPGQHNNWSGGADITVDPVTGTRNWFEAGTTNEKFLFNSDSFPGATLEFPISSSDYTANNDYRRKTGLEFMLNKIILSGDFSAATDRTATIPGHDLIFTNGLNGNPPMIELSATNNGAANFSFDLSLNIILYHDLTLSGDGDASLTLDGAISQYAEPRSLFKNGTSTITANGLRSYSGNTSVEAGTLSLGQTNPADDAATISISDGATLDLTFAGTDTIARLFIDGVQQPAGAYEAVGNPGSGNETSHISGQGTLTVTASPSGYATWAAQNAPGAPFDGDHDLDSVPNGIEYFMGESGNSFTAASGRDSSGNYTWPIASNYAGNYDQDFRVEISADLASWSPVPEADVTIAAGTSISYLLPTSSPAQFIRLSVDED